MTVTWTWSLEDVITTSGQAVQLDLDTDAPLPSGQFSYRERTFSGFIPGEARTVSIDVYTTQTASDGSPDVTGTDDFEGYADTAALHAFWAQYDLGAGATTALNTTDGNDGAKCAQISVTGHHQVSQLRHTFTGLSASTFYTATINAKRTSTDTHGECLIQCGGAGQTSSNVPHDNSWHTVSAIGRSDASGNLRIDFGFFVGFSFYPNDYAGNEWKAIFDGFSLAGPGLDPTDQPLQLGLEVVGQGSAILPTDIDLDSSIRTTLTVACVADASGEITVRFGCFGPA